jgi:hypothetical protein
VGPKFVPEIVTDAPTDPETDDRLVIQGIGMTVNTTALLLFPFTWTTTLPEVALAGTGATIELALQFVGVVATPLSVTALVP